MYSNKEYNFYINKNLNKNEINIIKNDNINKNSLFTDSDNDEFFKKNYDTEKMIIKNKNEYNIISNTTKPKNIDIINMEKITNNYNHINYNNRDNTIPISKKAQKLEIQSIDKILNFLKEDNDNINKYNNDFENKIYKNEQINHNMPSIEELQSQKEILINKLKKIKQKNKELMTYLEPYKQSMTNEDLENEERLKYIKYLDDKRKGFIIINNKLRHKLMNNQNINIRKKIEYLINKQIKEYEKLYNDDLTTNENINEIKTKNIYTNNNIEVKCELSLSGVNNNADYKLNNATTDGLINSKHINIINENLNNKKSNNTKTNKLNKNNSLIFGGEDKNKNNNNGGSLKFKKNNSKSNFLSSIKYIKNAKNTRNNNTSSSITSSHDNNNINNNNINNKKNDFKLLKPNSKNKNGLNFGIK